MLTRQGRMHPDIARFPNLAFYGGKLTEVPLPHQMNSSSSPRVRFIHVTPAMDVATDRVNANEAEAIARELLSIWECTQGNFSPAETVGVIVPYRNQISAISEKLSALLQEPEHPLMQITIDTVERYQGSQRDYIIYGFTVQRPYQLRFLTETTFVEDNQIIDRKLNVAMTRAREYLLITGNAPLLRTVPLYARLLDYIGDCS
jgi:superfamily I DNA and/or RNA helicase